MEKQFLAPAYIDWDADEISHHIFANDIKKTVDMFDKQVFVSMFLKSFYLSKLDSGSSLALRVKKIQRTYYNKGHDTTDFLGNEMKSTTHPFSYELDVKIYEENSKTSYNDYSLKIKSFLMTFDNYFTDQEQYDLLNWFFRLAKKHNINTTIHENKEQIDCILSKSFIHECAKKAWEEHYSVIYNDILQTNTPNETPGKKKKI